MHAIEVLNIFQFPEGDEKKLGKVLEQFERYCNPRKNVVFERLQFWQITEEFRNRGSICHAFENKVKSCECWSVDDMVRDKFVFSGCEGTTVERRKAYMLTLEKAICMARASEASKEQIKGMAPKEHSDENSSLHEIQYCGKQKKNSPRQPGSGPTLQQGNCKFCGSSHLWGSCPAFGKTCGYCQRKDHFARVCRKKLENLGGKTVHAMAEEPDDSDTGADLFTFSVE